MNIHICDVCTGRHLTSTCVLAERWVEECFNGTPDEMPAPVIDLTRAVVSITEWTHRKETARRRRNFAQKRDYAGIRATRLG